MKLIVDSLINLWDFWGDALKGVRMPLPERSPPVSEFAYEVLKLCTAVEGFLEYCKQYVPKELRDPPQPFDDDGGFAKTNELPKLRPIV